MRQTRDWGLIVNPVAGIGGPVGLKGSDGIETLSEALRRGGRPNASNRVRTTLAQLYETVPDVEITWHTGDGLLGMDVLQPFTRSIVSHWHSGEATTSADTQALMERLLELPLELIVVAGGDGTMRDVLDVIQNFRNEADVIPLVGIPAGTKIHSGAYCISPQAAGMLLAKVATGRAVEVQMADVMDIDERAFRQGIVRARKYGEVRILTDGVLVQNVKAAAASTEASQLLALAEGVVDRWNDDELVIVGSGGTLAEVMSVKGLPNTLLGIDVVFENNVIVADANESQLLEVLSQYQGHPKRLLVTAIGGQGHIFGRGNQPLSPTVLKHFDKSQIEVVATKAKMAQLSGRPLLVDTGDVACDQWLSGPIAVWVDYNECWYYPVAGLPDLSQP